MLKQFKVGILAVLVLGFMASCQSGNKEVRDAAQQSVVNNTTPATPAPNAKPQAPAVPTGPTTTIEFDQASFDFGTVDAGEKVSHTFKFTNTGKEPLIFTNAKGSCGCTVPTWPREAIAPGATGEVSVVFNSKNKKGKRNQKVTLTGNTNPPQTFIYLTGTVNADPNAKGAGGPKIKVTQ